MLVLKSVEANQYFEPPRDQENDLYRIALLTLYTLTSVSTFSVLFPIHFLVYRQGEFG